MVVEGRIFMMYDVLQWYQRVGLAGNQNLFDLVSQVGLISPGCLMPCVMGI